MKIDEGSSDRSEQAMWPFKNNLFSNEMINL